MLWTAELHCVTNIRISPIQCRMDNGAKSLDQPRDQLLDFLDFCIAKSTEQWDRPSMSIQKILWQACISFGIVGN